jgi:hypothetical protein
MFMCKNARQEYLNTEPRKFTNAPTIVARFANETALRGYLKDNHPEVPAGTKLEMVDMDSGRITEVVL